MVNYNSNIIAINIHLRIKKRRAQLKNWQRYTTSHKFYKFWIHRRNVLFTKVLRDEILEST